MRLLTPTMTTEELAAMSPAEQHAHFVGSQSWTRVLAA